MCTATAAGSEPAADSAIAADGFALAERDDSMSDHPGSSPDETSAVDAAEQDLKATAEAIRTDIGRLATIEDQKLALDPEDPEVDRLSDEAVDLADRISRETRAERQLSTELG